jgi:hypothetical protein
MARQRISPEWEEQVYELQARPDRPSVDRIFATIEERGRKQGRNDYPARDTVRRICERYRKLPDEVRLEYAPYRWPEAHDQGPLPWDAAPAGLELLRYRLTVGQSWPTIRVVKWFHRLRRALPGESADYLELLASSLATQEALFRAGRLPAPPDDRTLFLAMCPWRGPDEDLAFEMACERLGRRAGWPPARISFSDKEHRSEFLRHHGLPDFALTEIPTPAHPGG